jgi:hypothetical protein
MTRPPLPELLYLARRHEPQPDRCIECGRFPTAAHGLCTRDYKRAQRNGTLATHLTVTADPVRYLLWYLASDLYPDRRGDERTPRLALHVSQNGAGR